MLLNIGLFISLLVTYHSNVSNASVQVQLIKFSDIDDVIMETTCFEYCPAVQPTKIGDFQDSFIPNWKDGKTGYSLSKGHGYRMDLRRIIEKFPTDVQISDYQALAVDSSREVELVNILKNPHANYFDISNDIKNEPAFHMVTCKTPNDIVTVPFSKPALNICYHGGVSHSNDRPFRLWLLVWLDGFTKVTAIRISYSFHVQNHSGNMPWNVLAKRGYTGELLVRSAYVTLPGNLLMLPLEDTVLDTGEVVNLELAMGSDNAHRRLLSVYNFQQNFEIRTYIDGDITKPVKCNQNYGSTPGIQSTLKLAKIDGQLVFKYALCPGVGIAPIDSVQPNSQFRISIMIENVGHFYIEQLWRTLGDYTRTSLGDDIDDLSALCREWAEDDSAVGECPLVDQDLTDNLTRLRNSRK